MQQLLIGSLSLVLIATVVLLVYTAIKDFGAKTLLKYLVKVVVLFIIVMPVSYYLGGVVIRLLK